MKGVQGLVIAIVLGLIGGVVNWKYLSDQSKQKGLVKFIAVRPDKSIKQGQQFKAEDLAEVVIPEKHAKTLLRVAYTEKSYVVGSKATQDYGGDDIILRQELKTVSRGELPLEKNEVAVWVPVDTKRFVSTQVIPGQTQVMFRLPRVGPTPVGSTAENSTELIGPFDVLSVGNRRGEIDTMRSESVRPMQENVLTIRGKLVAGKQLDPLTSRVTNYLDKTNNRPLDVLLLPEPAPPK
ncbi:MAG: hypothetical protein K8T91_17900 [Planctomycetes bacterium]|nr:hypothetical protein [Planctomycetota bacterium]